jgi:hypothetical protein
MKPHLRVFIAESIRFAFCLLVIGRVDLKGSFKTQILKHTVNRFAGHENRTKWLWSSLITVNLASSGEPVGLLPWPINTLTIARKRRRHRHRPGQSHLGITKNGRLEVLTRIVY